MFDLGNFFAFLGSMVGIVFKGIDMSENCIDENRDFWVIENKNSTVNATEDADGNMMEGEFIIDPFDAALDDFEEGNRRLRQVMDSINKPSHSIRLKGEDDIDLSTMGIINLTVKTLSFGGTIYGLVTFRKNKFGVYDYFGLGKSVGSAMGYLNYIAWFYIYKYFFI